jgi:hypothetical protein
MTGARQRNHVPDVVSAITGKSHFIVQQSVFGWKVTIRPHRQPEEVVICKSQGEMNRLRMKLSEAGFTGLVYEREGSQ